MRELVASYFEHYFNLAGEKTLREYSKPLDLTRFDYRKWMTSEKGIEFLCGELDGAPHKRFLKKGFEKKLRRSKGVLFQAGAFTHPKQKGRTL